MPLHREKRCQISVFENPVFRIYYAGIRVSLLDQASLTRNHVLYRPNFCCNCGEKIERVDWNLLTSRRFCDVCAVENRKYDYAPRIAILCGVLAAVFGLGAIFGGRNSEQPASGGGDPRSEGMKFVKNVSTASAKPQSDLVETNTAKPLETQKSALAQQNSPIRASESRPEQIVYFCGALTKKGTPCTRKVKKKGERCWQHLGMPSAEELR